MFDLYDIWVFVLLIEIITIAKLFIIVHFFFLSYNTINKHLATFTQNLKVIKTTVFFSNLFCGGTRFFAPTLKTTLASEVDAPVITWYDSG